MEKRERWLVCSGRAEFMAIAESLVACERIQAIEWEPDALRVYTRAAALKSDDEARVVVGGGVLGVAAEDAACTLEALIPGRVVLCICGAAAIAASVAARGVTAVVEPAGLPKVLACGMGGVAPVEDARGSVEPITCECQSPLHVADMELEEPTFTGTPEETSESFGALSMRTTGRLPKVGVADEGLLAAINALPVPTEPITYRPLISLPQLDCVTNGLDSPVPTVCFASARGGVGKTALAVMTALALARGGLSVALIDMDFQFGTCLGYVGADETDGLLDPGGLPENIRVDACALARCRTNPEPGLVAYEFCKVPEQAEVVARFAGSLLKAASNGADIAVVDVPTGVGEAAAQVFDIANRCLLVTDRRAFSIESLMAQQSLCARMGIARTKLVTVVNRCDPRHRDEGFLERLRFSSQTSQIFKVVEGGQEVSQMLAIGSAGELLTARNRFALSASDLARAVAAEVGCGVGEHLRGSVLAGTPLPTPGPDRRPSRRRRKEQREEAVECPF